MKSVCFVLAKNPAEFKGGDMVISRLIMNLAAESCRVDALALTKSPSFLGVGPRAYGISKPQLNFAAIGVRAILRRRSPFHVRFDVPALRERLDTGDHDVFVAEHSYMAEPILASENAKDKLWINTHVSEADVARLSSDRTKRMAAKSALRDEIRVAMRARKVGCFDRLEISRYESYGIRNAELLRVTLPPAMTPADIASTDMSLLFLGDQTWWPNYQALLKLLVLWPRIHARVPGATLNIVGRKNPTMIWRPMDGAKHWGFVDDLTPFLTRSRAMIAPIMTGGGIRVKLLEACSNGIPVIASDAAVGSLDEILGLPAHNDDRSMVEECVRMLLDGRHAAKMGREFYDRNSNFWSERGPQRSVERWLYHA
jgi:polysaccharide biosynthesis protein PslH